MLKDKGSRAVDRTGLEVHAPELARIPGAVIPHVFSHWPAGAGVAQLRREGLVEAAHPDAADATECHAEVQQRCRPILVRARGDGLRSPPNLRLDRPEVRTLAHDLGEEVYEPPKVAESATLGYSLRAQVLQSPQHRCPAAIVHLSKALHESQYPSRGTLQDAEVGSPGHKRAGLEAPVVHRMPVSFEQGLLLAALLKVPLVPAVSDDPLLVGPLVQEAKKRALGVLPKIFN
mmetsp:Transcript_44725/g.127660  ORF Transcript_44725/g.127660 Transcript_44725/m.127660 type:complete len:232 (-) Transcript_44725:925-1620(-)